MEIDALEAAVLEDKYGSTEVDIILHSSEYEQEFDRWCSCIEKNFTLDFE